MVRAVQSLDEPTLGPLLTDRENAELELGGPGDVPEAVQGGADMGCFDPVSFSTPWQNLALHLQ